MHKLQEVWEKIGRKVRPKAALANQLRIPAQQQHQSSSLPIEPTALKSWLIAQGATNASAARSGAATGGAFQSAASAKSLLKALQHSNRTVISPLRRLQLMEQFEKPVKHALQGLDPNYLYLDFPLPANAEKTFQLTITLCQEMAYGYKIALADSIRQPASQHAKGHAKLTGNRLPGKSKRSHAVHEALEHLTRIALRHSQTNRDWPNDIWKDLNGLVRIAMHDRVNTTDVGKQSQSKQTSMPLTINNQFARLCALHILDQKKLTAEQVRGLFIQLTRNIDEVALHTRPQPADQYCVGNDSSPMLKKFCYTPAADDLLYFCIAGLLAKITAASEAHHWPQINNPQGMSRRESRTPRAQFITATSGLYEIYSRIKLLPPAEDAKSQFTDLHQLLVADRVQTLADRPLLQSADNGGIEIEVKDESANGFGLKWAGEDNSPCKIKIGELLAHRYRGRDAEVSWHLTVVRWLKTAADGSLYFGVESISQHTSAVNVVRLITGDNQIQKQIEGLLVNYQPIDSKAKMLVLPSHLFLPGETVGYRDDKGFHLVKLIESANRNDNFQCFAVCDVGENTEQLTTESADKMQMAV